MGWDVQVIHSIILMRYGLKPAIMLVIIRGALPTIDVGFFKCFPA